MSFIENFVKFSKNNLLLSIIAGIFYGLSYAPINSIFCVFISLSLLYFILNKVQSQSEGIKSVLIFGVVSYVISLHWIVNSLLIDLDQWWFLIPFAIILIPLVLSLYYLIISISFFHIRKKADNPVILGLVFSFLWLITELARGYLFTGFPWNLLGTIWVDCEWISKIIFYTNIYFLSFLTILFITSLFNFIFIGYYRKISALFLFSIFCFVCCIKIYDKFKVSIIPEKNNLLKVRIVHPNIEQKFKWIQGEEENIFLKITSLSFKKGFKNNLNDKPDLIIWPETAFPFIIDVKTLNQYNSLQNVINRLEKDQLLLLGALRINHHYDEREIFNSMMVFRNSVDGQLVDYYDKRHLVPFGEFVPFYDILQKFLNFIDLDDVSNLFANLTPGFKSKNELLIKNDFNVLPLICYEGIFRFDYNKNDSVKFAINLTNDAWFGDSFGPYQHLRMVQSRVIESGLPLIRVANGGISVLIDSNGKILERLNIGDDGILDIELKY